jgi:hypothetical protein
MDAYGAYIMYLALKRHFTSGSGYDYFKYNKKVNASVSSFETRKDKYAFHKLSKKADPENFLVAVFIEHGTKPWIGEIVSDPKFENTYKEWLKRKESLTYIVKNEISDLDVEAELKVEDGQYPILLKKYMDKEVSIETLIILSNFLGFFKHWNKQIEDSILWPDIYNMCMKYSPFIEYDRDKFKKLIVEQLVA